MENLLSSVVNLTEVSQARCEERDKKTPLKNIKNLSFVGFEPTAFVFKPAKIKLIMSLVGFRHTTETIWAIFSELQRPSWQTSHITFACTLHSCVNSCICEGKTHPSYCNRLFKRGFAEHPHCVKTSMPLMVNVLLPCYVCSKFNKKC